MVKIEVRAGTKKSLDEERRKGEDYDAVIRRLLRAAKRPRTTYPGGATPMPGIEPSPIPERPPDSPAPGHGPPPPGPSM